MSNDLRKRIIEAKSRGETNKKIAREKEVSESAVERLLALYHATPNEEENDVWIKLQPDIRLLELIKELEKALPTKYDFWSLSCVRPAP